MTKKAYISSKQVCYAITPQSSHYFTWRDSYVHRLVLGALTYRETHSHIITRDFRISYAYENEGGSQPDPTFALNQLRNWNPDGLFCALGTESLEKVIQSLPESRPAVNMFAARPMPGMVVVAASQATMFKMAIQHLRQQGLRSLAYLDLEDPSLHPARCNLFNQLAKVPGSGPSTFITVVKPACLEVKS